MSNCDAIDCEVVNCGVNGMMVPREHTRYIGRIRASKADLVIVMLGTNDLLSGLSAEEITQRMGAFLDSIIEAAGTGAEGSRVMLIAPPVLQPGEWVLDDDLIFESEDLGGLYQELASRKGCLFADAGKWDIDVTFDGVHFSPEGHASFARNLATLLTNA